MKQRLLRNLRAQWRDARVLLHESRRALLLFAGTVLAGGLVFRFAYYFPETGAHPGFAESIYASFALIFFQPTLPFPTAWPVQALYFLIPTLGLASIADGLVHFGAALVNKNERGQKWQVAMASTYSDHVIVCGIGKVGYRVILELLRFGREVVAMDQDADCRFAERVKAAGVPLIVGDARRQEVLLKAGVERADAIIPATNDELANLDIALDARELNPDIQVVMRLFDPDLARRVEQGFGIQTALSVSALAAPLFATAAMRVPVKHSFYVGDALLHISELVVAPGSQLVGWSIGRLETELDMSVIYYRDRATTSLHPGRQTELSAGEHVLVLAQLKALQKLNKLNG